MAIKEEEITINQKTSGVVLSDAVANVDSEVISYSIPDKSAIKIRPIDTFDIYLATSAPAELAADSLVTLIATDPMGRRTEVIYQGQYRYMKETRNAMEKLFLKKTTKLTADFIFKVKVLAAAAADDAQTRFNLTCLLAYETLD